MRNLVPRINLSVYTTTPGVKEMQSIFFCSFLSVQDQDSDEENADPFASVLGVLSKVFDELLQREGA